MQFYVRVLGSFEPLCDAERVGIPSDAQLTRYNADRGFKL